MGTGSVKGCIVSVVLGCGVIAAALLLAYPLSGPVIQEVRAEDNAMQLNASRQRHIIMEEMEELVEKLALMARDNNAYDASVIRNIGNQIKDRLSRVHVLFAKESVLTDGRAKKSIWDNKPEFDQLLNDTLETVLDVPNVKGKDDLLVLVNELDRKCSNCHDKYRHSPES